jgi:hypothetical protein
MKFRPFFVLAVLAAPVLAQSNKSAAIPRELWGKWVITKEIKTRAISCWGEQDAKRVLRTTIEYSPTAITWRKLQVKAGTVTAETVSAAKFQKENSSPSVNGSQLDFKQLQIKAESVTQVSIEHHPARITQATTEFPGDQVLIKDPDTLVFSICNLYFEAKRHINKETVRIQ